LATRTQLGGTIQLNDGRTIPVVVSLDPDTLDLNHTGPLAAASERLILRAVEVFGKAEKAQSWLNSPNRELGGQCPREFATTKEGLEQVLGILADLEYGFPA
jgi:hypothetical protein